MAKTVKEEILEILESMGVKDIHEIKVKDCEIVNFEDELGLTISLEEFATKLVTKTILGVTGHGNLIK